MAMLEDGTKKHAHLLFKKYFAGPNDVKRISRLLTNRCSSKMHPASTLEYLVRFRYCTASYNEHLFGCSRSELRCDESSGRCPLARIESLSRTDEG
jgi:hypothetical protein